MAMVKKSQRWTRGQAIELAVSQKKKELRDVEWRARRTGELLHVIIEKLKFLTI
jgi:hypothetical protein